MIPASTGIRIASTESIAAETSSMIETAGAPVPAVVMFTAGRNADRVTCTALPTRQPAASRITGWI